MKAKIAIIGKGNIGWAIKQLLKDDYEIKHGDITEGLDARDIDQVKEFLKGTDAVISAGPFAINQNIGTVAAEMGIGYFDLTEDVETTEFIRSIDSQLYLLQLWPALHRILLDQQPQAFGRREFLHSFL